MYATQLVFCHKRDCEVHRIKNKLAAIRSNIMRLLPFVWGRSSSASDGIHSVETAAKTK